MSSTGERLSIHGVVLPVFNITGRLMPIENFEHRPGGLDPADVFSAAQTIAAKLVATGQDPDADEATVQWLVDLVNDVGLDTMARLWADAPAVTFGGALWRLYALQQATQRAGDRWAAWYRAGHDAYASRVIAGATEPPQAKDLHTLITKILTGVYAGDFAIALERGGAASHRTSSTSRHTTRSLAARRHEHRSPTNVHYRTGTMCHRWRRHLGRRERRPATNSRPRCRSMCNQS